MLTDTKEKGLETLIVEYLRDQNRYEQGTSSDYDREFAVDTPRLFRFLKETQPEKVEMLGIFSS